MSPTKKPTHPTDDDDVEEPLHNRRATDHWRIDKRVPVMLFVAVIGQTAGGIWWMAQMSSDLRSAVSAIAEFKNERYTREDARRDRELLEQKLELLKSSDRELERRINLNENRVDRIDRDGAPSARPR